VGTIRFASAQPDSNKQAFHKARDRHRIKVGSKLDWDGNRAIYGWRVGSVPIPVGTTGQTSFGARSFSVVFATTAAQHDPSDNVRAGKDDLRKSVIASRRGCPDGAISDRPLSIFGDSTSNNCANVANAIGSASDDQGGHAYYEIQVGGWCGMHALNHYLGGPYITPDSCRRACSQVVVALSEAAGGRAEDSSHHLDQESGWLSIDVINILDQALFGFQVEGCSTPLDEWATLGDGTALVNWNKQHWTVLTSRSCNGPWVHGGDESFHGRVETQEMSVVSGILSDIRRCYGGVPLHRIVRASSAGHQLLEAAGMQAMLPPDAPEVNGAVLSDAQCSDTSNTQEISLVTVNVDGLGEYPRSPTERMASILEEVLRTSPDFLLMQEVTMQMYMGALFAEACCGESAVHLPTVTRSSLLWPWVLLVSWQRLEFDSTLGYPGEGPGTPARPALDQEGTFGRAGATSSRSSSIGPQPAADLQLFASPRRTRRRRRSPNTSPHVAGLSLDEDMVQADGVPPPPSAVESRHRSRSRARPGTRVHCPVAGCSCTAGQHHRGWGSVASMVLHINAHLSGQLQDEVPASWLSENHKVRCRVCGLCVAASRGFTTPAARRRDEHCSRAAPHSTSRQTFVSSLLTCRR